jgi:uncharacterized 2Fe-2S/4Fe-4S cluster protein (DUF4445 family)
MPNFSISIIPDNKQVTVNKKESLYHAMAVAGIPLKASCGGKGTCSDCKVLVREGQVDSLTTGMLTEEEQKQGYLLACQCFPQSNLVVEVPAESKLAEHRIVLSSSPESGNIAQPGDERVAGILVEEPERGEEGPDIPLFKRVFLKVPEPSLDDMEDDIGRLMRAIRKETGVEILRPTLDVLRTLPKILRQAGWKVTVSLAEPTCFNSAEITGVEPGFVEQKYYGLAVDIGTTTIVAKLVDLESGHTVGIKGTYNKQAVFGDDVITRIIHTNEYPDGLRELQKVVIETINELIEDLAKEQRIKQTDIRTVVCAGNTIMTHLFLGLDPTYIRLEPYTPVANDIPAVRASRAGLNVYPMAWVQCVAGVASYMGGDVTAGVLVSGMAFAEELILFVDIGTNGEMVLGNKEWLISCACSAGPAFEGGGIRHGMRAMRGAIEKVRISPGGREVTCCTIGNMPPTGICGSGLIDCIAWLYKSGIIDRSGNFISDVKSPRIRASAEGKEFVLVWSEKAGRFTDITISEAEIKNLIRSKAAVYAGIRSMLQMVGLPVEAIDRVVIAGGFGRYINIRDAINIGMFPDIPLEKYSYVGNSSVKGAKMALLSRNARKQLVEIAKKMTYLELSIGNTFMDEFVSALFIPHTDLGLFPSMQKR